MHVFQHEVRAAEGSDGGAGAFKQVRDLQAGHIAKRQFRAVSHRRDLGRPLHCKAINRDLEPAVDGIVLTDPEQGRFESEYSATFKFTLSADQIDIAVCVSAKIVSVIRGAVALDS